MTDLPTANILDYFSFESDQELVSSLLLSFSLDPDFFTYDLLGIMFNVTVDPVSRETRYLTELKSRLERTQLTVIINRRDYESALDFMSQNVLQEPSFLGYTLAAAPFRLFHPKLYLLVYRLKSKPKSCNARLIIGSANLTKKAMRQSAETFAVLELSESDRKWLRVFEMVQAFLAALMQRLDGITSEAVVDLAKLLGRCRAKTEKTDQCISFIHSMGSEPIINQIESIFDGEKITRVRAVSPFFEDNSELGASLLRRILDGDISGPYSDLDEVTILFRATRRGDKFGTRLPLETIRKLPPKSRSKLKLYALEDIGGIDSEEPRIPRFMHGKLFAFANRKKTVLVLGSPNFSNRALLLAGDEANVETALIFETDSTDPLRIFPDSKIEVQLSDLFQDEKDPDETPNSDLWLFVQDCRYNVREKILTMLLSSKYEPVSDWKILLSGKEILTKSTRDWVLDKELSRPIEALPDRYLVLITPTESHKFMIRTADVDALLSDSTYEELLLDLQGAISEAANRRTQRLEEGKVTVTTVRSEPMDEFFAAVNNLKRLIRLFSLDPYGKYRIERLAAKVEKLRTELLKRHQAGERPAITLFKLAQVAEALHFGDSNRDSEWNKSIMAVRVRILADLDSVRSQGGFGEVESILNDS